MKTRLAGHDLEWIHFSFLIIAVGLMACPVAAQRPAAETKASPNNARGHRSAGDARNAADYFPLDTLAVARIGDVAQFRETRKNSSFGAQADDPALRKFFSSVLRKLSRLSDGLGVGVTDLWELVDGEFSLAAIKNQEGRLSVLAVADLGDEASAQDLVRRLEKQLQAEAADLTTVYLSNTADLGNTAELGPTQLRSWRRDARRNLANVSYFVQGGQVVFGENLQMLAETARRGQNAEADALAGNENFRHVMSRIAPGGDDSGINWYLNPTAVVQAAVAANLGGNAPPERVRQMIDAFGLEQVRGVGGTVWLGQGGMDSVSTTYGYVQTPVSGALTALTLPASAQRPPDWVKENVSLYAQLNWSVARFVETLRDVMDRSRGAGAFGNLLGSLQVAADGTTLAEVVQVIDGPLYIAAEIPQNAAEFLRQRAVFGFGIRDPELIRGLLRQTAEDRNESTEKIGGAEMVRFRLDISGALPGAGELPPMEIGIAVTDEAVLFSPNADYLAETFSDQGHLRPLADSPEYQQIAAKFPEQTSMITFQRQDGRLEGLYEQLRGGLLNPAGIPGMVAGLADFQFQALPPFPTMSRYLQTTGSFIVPEEDGFRIVSLALPPREQ